MPRQEGQKFRCETCGASLTYDTACTCPPEMPHVEMCCNHQMSAVPA